MYFIMSCSQVFSLLFDLFLELKYKKYCNLLSHNYFLFTFDIECLKIIAFSKRDGWKMDGANIELGKKMTPLQYAIIALQMPVCQY